MYPAEHYYFTFGGPLGSMEQWSMGLRLDASFQADATTETETAALEDLNNVLTLAWDRTPNPIGGQATVAWVKYNRIGTDGKYVRNVTNVRDRSALKQNVNGVLPYSVSVVATLETSVQRGLASKGRIYLPAPRLSCAGPDNTIPETEAQGGVTWVAQLLSDINALTSVGTVVVASGIREGAIRPVTGVNIGSVHDTMRSRRNKMLETRVAATVAGSGVGGDF